MTDKELMDVWREIEDPKKALLVLVANWDFIGNDPYYRELCNALYEMAERCAE